MRRRTLFVTVVLAALSALLTGAMPADAATLFSASFPAKTTLVTNEYAYWNPKHADKVVSPTWELTSGSLFAKGGTGWTGKIDDGRPDAHSAKATNSATFRMRSRVTGYGDVTLSMDLSVLGLTATASTPKQNWDGVHLWLRYQSQYQLYAVSVARRDGVVVIKKKCPGGPSNDGTYYPLGKQVSGVPIPLNTWRSVSASVKNTADGNVALSVSVAGQVITTAVDNGVGCAAIRSAGSIGVRGDNAQFQFRKLTVSRL